MKTETIKTIETTTIYEISYEEIEQLILDHLHIKNGITDFRWCSGSGNICRLKVIKTEYKNEEESKEERVWHKCLSCKEEFEVNDLIIGEKVEAKNLIYCPICSALQ